MLKRWWGRLKKRQVVTESGRDETGDEIGGSGYETGGPGDETGDKTAATAGDERVMYTDKGELKFESTSAIFVWRALQNFATADFEENVEEMVGTTREAAGGDRVRRGRDRGRDRRSQGRDRRRRLVTNETAATGGVMYKDKGELEFDEDEMAALEWQCLVAKLFPDFGSEPDFEGFHASEPAGNLSGGNDSGSEDSIPDKP